MSSDEFRRPRIKLPLNPFLFKQTPNLLYQVALLGSASLIFLLVSLYFYLPPAGVCMVWWVIPFISLILVVIYWLINLRQSRNLTPLDEVSPQMSDLVVKLAGKKYLMCEPPPSVFLTHANIVAKAWFENGEGRIGMGRRFVAGLGNDETLWAAILLHEMSHLKNGDISLRYANRFFIFYASLLVLGLGLWGALWGGGHSFPLQGLALAVSVFLLLLWMLWRAGLLAEMTADLRATLAIGDNRGILEALRRLRQGAKSWQGGALEARETILLNLVDPYQSRLLSFFFYGLLPALSGLVVLTGLTYLGSESGAENTQDVILLLSSVFYLLAAGLSLYWAVQDLSTPLIALGAKSVLPFLVVFLLGECIAEALIILLFPALEQSNMLWAGIILLVLMMWVLGLLLREFKGGAPITVVLRGHNHRLLAVGLFLPVLAVAFLLIGEHYQFYSDEQWQLPFLSILWLGMSGFWLWVESMRFMPHKTSLNSWSQPLTQSPPDRGIDLTEYKPITREQEIALGCFDLGLILALVGAIGMICQVVSSGLIIVMLVAVFVVYSFINNDGRRSWGAWLLGSSPRTGHRKAPHGKKSVLLILRLINPQLKYGEMDWVAVEEPRWGTTGTLWLGILFASLGLTMLFLKIGEVV